MAPSAADLRLGPLAPLADLLEPRPGRVEFALRLALICALTGLVAEIYQTPSPALTIYVAFFLNRSDRASSLLMNVAMVLVISIVIGLVFLVAQLVIDDPMWRVSAMAAISVAFLFLGSASKLRPVGATLALIVAYALDLLGNIPVGEAATRALLYAWLFVGIPASVSIVVNLLCATPPKRLAERLLAWRLRLAAGKLTGGDERSDRAFREALREGVQPIERLLHLAKMEHASPVRELAALRQAAGSTFALMSAIDVMDRVPVTDVTVDLRRRIAGALDEMASEFDAGALPAGMVWEGVAPEAGLDPLTAELLVEIRSILEAFARPTEERAPSVPAEPKSGFFEADAFTNPDHVRYALKTTAAAMSCYVLYSLLDWPGIHTCFITCYIVSLGTAAESVEKLTLRIAGCLVGAAAGYAVILSLLPSITSVAGLMAVIFPGALAAAYVAAGSPRISYAGFQIGFAYFLCVVQGIGPAFDLVTARDRVIGILIGNVVTYLVLTRIAPVSVARRIDRAIATLMRNLATIARDGDVFHRRHLASEAQATLAGVETDLDLLRYEPASVRPPVDWQAARAGVAREAGMLIGPFLFAGRGEAAERLEAATAAFESSELRRVEGTETSDRSGKALGSLVDAQIDRLGSAILPMSRHQAGMGAHAIV